MARTKKYLISSKGARSRPGFYRPLKRLKDSSSALQQTEMEPVSRARSSLQIPEDTASQTGSHNERPLAFSSRSSSYGNTNTSSWQPDLREQTAIPQPDDLDFNHHDVGEKITLLEKQLNNALKKESQFKEDIAQLKTSLQQERQELESTIKTLQRDVNQIEPIKENRFFSISKELQEVVTAMNHLLETESYTTAVVTPSTDTATLPSNPALTQAQAPIQPQPSITPSPATVPPAITVAQPEVAVTPTPVTNPPVASPAAAIAQPAAAPQPQTGKKVKIPKPLIVFGLTLAIVALIGGSAWFFVNRKTEVNASLVQEYLPKTNNQNASPQAAEKKIDSSNTPENKSTDTNTQTNEQTKGASDNKYEQSQAAVPFTDTKWDTLKDPSFGIEVNYPSNAVNVIKTDSSITFIRKTGYIFKIQVIETALSVQEYWKMVSASSLKYKIKETTFRDHPALYMELEDFSEYPGDKYLVKNGDYIYDIWYATYSNTLSDDDAKRIDIMLNSFKFTSIVKI